LNNQINNFIEESEELKFDNENKIKLKEQEITELTDQIYNFDDYIQKYQNDLIDIKANYDLKIDEYEQKLYMKDLEISQMRDNYEKEKYEVN
jgi:hypothetical protein